MSKTVASDMDGGWKQIIEDFTEEFFRFFYPAVHARIDWTKGCRFLDTELRQVMPDAELGKAEADKLIEVHRRGGGTAWILIHVEVQAQPETAFPERMFLYYYRIRDRYKRSVVSLALLVDGDQNFRPDQFCLEELGCRMEFTFPMVKLLDHKTEQQLKSDPSPFAVASLVQLRKIQAGSNMEHRYDSKLALLRELYRRGYRRDDILKLFRFMDYILTLPDDLSIRFRSELELIEEELKMPYVTSVERIARQEGIEKGIEEGIEKGIEKGVVQGVRETLVETLRVRFDDVPQWLVEKIEQCTDVQTLRSLHQQALKVESLADLQL
ncbi:MAG: hypothetical protein ISR77_17515 [Pirellulaceae bacterium]|nr:hypothetical protein [Pirellulaceae bacterium]